MEDRKQDLSHFLLLATYGEVQKLVRYGHGHDLLFHMTQSTSRSTIGSHSTKQNQLLVNITANENAMEQ